jgi:hypothetical protein
MSGRAAKFVPVLSLNTFLALPEVRKIEFKVNSIYGFNEIIILTFKMPESKSDPVSDKIYVIPHIKNTAIPSLMSTNLFKNVYLYH